MIGKSIETAIEFLEKEKVVAIPTETVYGLAGNAYSKKAVSAIFEAKNRPNFDPLIVHVASRDQLLSVVEYVPPELEPLIEAFMPGPLTLLLPKNERISDLVTAGSPMVAVRMPSHPITHKLLSRLSFPLTAPSANPFGYISPTTAQHVAQQLGTKIPYILDGGSCGVGVESTIVGVEEGKISVFRKGGIAIEDLESIVGKLHVKQHSTSNPKAPGMLKSHYAPNIPFVVGDIPALLDQHQGKTIGVLSFSQYYAQVEKAHQVQLSETASLREAAQRLFAAMRYLDGQALDLIVAEWLPEKGLGRAINDRLKRAAARN